MPVQHNQPKRTKPEPKPEPKAEPKAEVKAEEPKHEVEEHTEKKSETKDQSGYAVYRLPGGDPKNGNWTKADVTTDSPEFDLYWYDGDEEPEHQTGDTVDGALLYTGTVKAR